MRLNQLKANPKRGILSYRNKTYVAFASEDIKLYRLMEAWKANARIDFNFFDAHSLFISNDSSKPETIKRNLRERMKNAKQVVFLSSASSKSKGDDGVSFLAHELKVINEFNLPVVIANLSQSRKVEHNLIPIPLSDRYTISVSFQPAIIQYALEHYNSNLSRTPHFYPENVYKTIGI